MDNQGYYSGISYEGHGIVGRDNALNLIKAAQNNVWNLGIKIDSLKNASENHYPFIISEIEGINTNIGNILNEIPQYL